MWQITCHSSKAVFEIDIIMSFTNSYQNTFLGCAKDKYTVNNMFYCMILPNIFAENVRNYYFFTSLCLPQFTSVIYPLYACVSSLHHFCLTFKWTPITWQKTIVFNLINNVRMCFNSILINYWKRKHINKVIPPSL